MAMDPGDFQFALEEYRSLRSEIDIRIKEAFSLIIYCLTAVGAAYGLFFSAQTSTKVACGGHQFLINLAAYSGTLFPIFGWIKSHEAWSNVLKIAEYTRALEKKIGVIGWEHQAKANREKDPLGPLTPSQPPYHLFWFILICGTIIFDGWVLRSKL